MPAVCCCSCAVRSDVGAVPELSAVAGSVWVGVDLDEPAGKHAGSVLGTRYFTARGAKHGTFVKPAAVQCGDYPEIDPFADDEDERDEAEGHTDSAERSSEQASTQSETNSTAQSSQTDSPDKSALYEEL